MSDSGLMMRCLQNKSVPERIAESARDLWNGILTEKSEAPMFLLCGEELAGGGGSRSYGGKLGPWCKGGRTR
jgi:hypothetical protein